jgi:hypothetical protein
VEINIRGIVNYIDFFIINKGLDKILLRMLIVASNNVDLGEAISLENE